MVFATDRLQVRRIERTDYDSMLEVYGDLELMRYVGDGSAITQEDCSRWIDVTLDNYRRRGYGLFVVESGEPLQHVGFVGLTHPGGRSDPEIKYVVRAKYSGNGLAQELLAGTCAHAHREWGLERIIATVHPDNQVSNHILRKCGFLRLADQVNEDGSVTFVWEHIEPTADTSHAKTAEPH